MCVREHRFGVVCLSGEMGVLWFCVVVCLSVCVWCVCVRACLWGCVFVWGDACFIFLCVCVCAWLFVCVFLSLEGFRWDRGKRVDHRAIQQQEQGTDVQVLIRLCV